MRCRSRARTASVCSRKASSVQWEGHLTLPPMVSALNIAVQPACALIEDWRGPQDDRYTLVVMIAIKRLSTVKVGV